MEAISINRTCIWFDVVSACAHEPAISTEVGDTSGERFRFPRFGTYGSVKTEHSESLSLGALLFSCSNTLSTSLSSGGAKSL